MLAFDIHAQPSLYPSFPRRPPDPAQHLRSIILRHKLCGIGIYSNPNHHRHVFGVAFKSHVSGAQALAVLNGRQLVFLGKHRFTHDQQCPPLVLHEGL